MGVGGLMKRVPAARKTWVSKISPWLMLPPALEEEGGDMVYRFYSLEDKKVVRVNKRGGGESEVPVDESVVVGSSHGWLALYNKRNRDLFLSNPLTRQHVKLPTPAGGVGKVIPSCNSDGCMLDCVMIYGPENDLAYCDPGPYYGHGHCWWTSLSTKKKKKKKNNNNPVMYRDCAYSSKYAVFLASANSDQFEAWNLQKYRQPWMSEIKSNDIYYSDDCCLVYKSIAVAENDALELYDVTRYVEKTSNKTIKFDVCKYCWEEKAWSHIKGSLDGLSFFVGINHSFVLSAKDFPYLKPDAIYFTPPPTHHDHDDHDDVGVFDYATQQFSPLYYPPHHHNNKKKLTSSFRPFFFTPDASTRI